MTPQPSLRGGLTHNALMEAFLSAPLLALPCCHCIFQQDEVDVNVAKASYDQFVECYHNVATTIDAGFGPKTTLSPSAWLKSVVDLTSQILYRVVATRTHNLTATPEG
jgi:hypothetical protein